ncbi:MAG: hypothetical protein QF704_07435, partial [Anaerolineales bacterium]|nr:hypothetical protein [Anaerolineales bacterium]
MTGKYNKILRIIFALLFSLTIISCSDEKEEFTDDTTTDNSSTGGDNITTKLSAPTGLSTVGSAGQVVLNWTTLSGASSYTVFWDNSTGVSSSSNVITSVSNDNYTHSSLDNGTTYYYKVAGVNSYGIGTLSSEVSASTPLPAPANLSATAGNKLVVLGWDNVSGASSYTVYWDNATGVSTSNSAITNVSDDNYTHTGLNAGTYYYKVAAVNSTGTGTLSSEINATASSIQLIGGTMQGSELNLDWAVTTFAGAGYGGHNDDTGTAAVFRNPKSITTDGTNLYVADYDNHKIRKIVISSKVVTTLAGSTYGYDDGTGTDAKFHYPSGITTDGTNLYVAESGTHQIRKIVISSKVVTKLAGYRYSGDTDDTGEDARFNTPVDLTTDGTNLYVTDNKNHTIRKVVISSGVVTTFAGTSGSSGSTDDTGNDARFKSPKGITTDGTNLYVVDGNLTIRKIVISSRVVTTLAGTAGGNNYAVIDDTGPDAAFNTPYRIATDGTNLYVTEYNKALIRKIVISNGVVTTVAGTINQTGTTDGTGAAARFYRPH